MRCAEYPVWEWKSVEQLYHTLKERNILENKETCILFRYPFCVKIHKECRNCIQTFAMTMDMIDVLSLLFETNRYTDKMG